MDTRGRRALWSLGDDGRCGHYGATGIVVTRGRRALWSLGGGGWALWSLGGDGRCGH